MELFKQDNLYGIKGHEEDIIVPNSYENPLDAIAEWKYFELDNYHTPVHLKYLPIKTIQDIEKVEKELLNSIKYY